MAKKILNHKKKWGKVVESGEKYVTLKSKFYYYIRTYAKHYINKVRFLGNIEAKTDAKGRVFLPATFRKVMQSSGETELVMRKDVFQDCLVLYPGSVWDKQTEMLRCKLNRWNRQHQQVFRQYVSDVEVITPDASGRILIPRRYQEMCGIQQQVRFLGVDDTIEIWPSTDVNEPFVEPQEFAEILEGLMGNGGTIDFEG